MSKKKEPYKKQISMDLGYYNGDRIREVKTVHSQQEEKELRDWISDPKNKQTAFEAKLIRLGYKKAEPEPLKEDIFVCDYIEDAVTKYCDMKDNIRKRKLSDCTRIGYLGETKYIKNKCKSNVLVRDMSVNEVNALLDKFSGKYSERTIDGVMRVLRMMFEIAKEDGIIDENPMSSKKLRTPAGITKKIKKQLKGGAKLSEIEYNNTDDVEIYSDSQLDRIEAACENNVYLSSFIKVLESTGLRFAEALALKLSDIDREKKQIKIQRALTKSSVHTEDGKERIVYVVGNTKNRKSRIVDMPDTLIKVIDNYVKESNKNPKIMEGRKKTDFIFMNEKGERQSPDGMRGRFSNIVRRHKLQDIEFGFHKYRHTFCTRLYEEGADPKYIMEVAGHTDISVTYKYYVKMTERTRNNYRPVIEKIGSRGIVKE